MNFFSPTQIKILLITWPLLLVFLFTAATYISFARLESNVSAGLTLVASSFVIAVAQITMIVYSIATVILLALWFFGGHQRNLRDYGLIMLAVAIVFAALLRDVPLNFW